MKINNLKINNYGKLENKEIELNKNINIIYGENESGKSTLLSFILSMFYGISKNKDGKEYSDYDRYLPWSDKDFSGKLNYELNNSDSFDVFRNFNKKNPKIFNSQMEDISKDFNIDKTKGNQFFLEQTKMDKNIFLSSLVVSQEQVKLDKNEQNTLIQKIINLVGTGEDNISYTKALANLNKKQSDEIGTLRSKEKPINILSRKIEELNREKYEIKQISYTSQSIEENCITLENDINKVYNKIAFLKEYKSVLETSVIDIEKIKIKENDLNTYSSKQEELEIKKNNLSEKQKNISQKFKLDNTLKLKAYNSAKLKLTLFSLILLLINISQFIFVDNIIQLSIGVISFIIIAVISIFYLINKKNNLKLKQLSNNLLIDSIDKDILSINTEIDFITTNRNKIKEDIDTTHNIVKNDFDLKIKKLNSDYINMVSSIYLTEILQIKDLNQILSELSLAENSIHSKKIELHKLKIEQENISNNIRNFSNIEEELNICLNKKSDLEELNTSIECAKLYLKNAYEKMKNTISPKFAKNLSNISSAITNNKYSNIMFNEDSGLIVELDNGNYEPISKLSIGTIDQLYLSLRLSMSRDFSSESMPIILDEAFAYYDTCRLKNILSFISTNLINHQIIIFTCTNREKNILDELNINYNFISI